MAKRAVHFLQPERRLADIKETEELPNERWLEERPEGNADDGRETMEESNPFWKLRKKDSGRTLDDLTEQEGKVKDKAIRKKRQLASDTAEGSGRDPIARIAALEGKENICTADSQNMLRENHSDKESLPKPQFPVEDSPGLSRQKPDEKSVTSNAATSEPEGEAKG